MKIRKAHKWEQVWIQEWENEVRKILLAWLGPSSPNFPTMNAWKVQSSAGDIFLSLEKDDPRFRSEKSWASLHVRFEEPKLMGYAMRTRLWVGLVCGKWNTTATPQQGVNAAEKGRLIGEYVKNVLSGELFKVTRESVI